jgi:hypothetical protein
MTEPAAPDLAPAAPGRPPSRPPGPPRPSGAAQRAKAKDRAPSEPRPPTPRSIEARAGERLTELGFVWFAVSPADGLAFLNGVPRLAAALDHAAKENPRLRVLLERFLTVSVWGELAAAAAAIALPILANHKLIPAAMADVLAAGAAPTVPPAGPGPGVPSPADLAAMAALLGQMGSPGSANGSGG